LAPERSRKKDVVDKYVPVRQPIQKRPPDGLNLVRLTWVICKRWNDEFLGTPNQSLAGLTKVEKKDDEEC
jgi:hypothetical protein